MATNSLDHRNTQTTRRWERLLTREGICAAELTLGEHEWTEWAVETSIVDGSPARAEKGAYVVPLLPVEFHCHGLRGMDFSNFERLELAAADLAARDEGVLCVLTMFLPDDALSAFDGFMRAFDRYQRAHPSSHLAGVALEGPLLASVGGTPRTGSWVPSSTDWRQIAAWGAYGLKYVVLSPDVRLDGSRLMADAGSGPSTEAIVETLFTARVVPALGHFQRSDPKASAGAIRKIIDIAKRHGVPVLTDHLFNDMPLNFQHAWRTSDEKAHRDHEALKRELESWDERNLELKLGAVPATLIAAARDGDAILCVNFDGDHVDHAVCRRVQELIDSDRMIAMTDRVETDTLGGSALMRRRDNSLWYRADGSAVAAGSTSIDQAMRHLRALGADEQAIWNMASVVAYEALGLPLPDPLQAPPVVAGCSWVDRDGTRGWLARQDS